MLGNNIHFYLFIGYVGFSSERLENSGLTGFQLLSNCNWEYVEVFHVDFAANIHIATWFEDTLSFYSLLTKHTFNAHRAVG